MTSRNAIVNGTIDTLGSTVSLGFWDPGDVLTVTGYQRDANYGLAKGAVRVSQELAIGIATGAAAKSAGTVGTVAFGFDMAGNVAGAGRGAVDAYNCGLNWQNGIEIVGGAVGLGGGVLGRFDDQVGDALGRFRDDIGKLFKYDPADPHRRAGFVAIGASKPQQTARFIADDAGNVVDTLATPPGRYLQPDGSATDILQQVPHPGLNPFARRTHTHPAIVNRNPLNPAQGSTRLGDPRHVSTEDILNIMNGNAKRSKPKGR